jgi:hypothetical protein
LSAVFLADSDDLTDDFKEAKRDGGRNDVADEANEYDTRRRMEREEQARQYLARKGITPGVNEKRTEHTGRNPNSYSKKPTGFQRPDTVPESDAIDTVLSNRAPRTPTHHGSVASTSTYQPSSPASRLSTATTAMSTPKTPGVDVMQPSGADKEGKVSSGHKFTGFFKRKQKADTTASPQRKLPQPTPVSSHFRIIHSLVLQCPVKDLHVVQLHSLSRSCNDSKY